MCGWRPNSYDIYKSRRWGDCTFARASPVSLSRKPLSPDIEATPKTNLPISFALARSSPNMASYWLCNDLQYASSVILSAEKQLLSVRNQTCSDLVRAELGYPDLKVIVKESQIKFMKKLTSRDDYEGSPAQLALHLAVHVESQAGNYVSSLLNSDIAGLRTDNIESLRCKLLESESSRRKTYCEFNPDVMRHPI